MACGVGDPAFIFLSQMSTMEIFHLDVYAFSNT